MRIAINTLNLGSTKVGVGNYIVESIKNLQEIDKVNNYLIICNNLNKKFFDITNSKFQTYLVNNLFNFKLMRLLWEQLILPFVLKFKSVDILHSTGFVSPLIKTTKQVLTIHDMTHINYNKFHNWYARIYFPLLLPLSAKSADMIIADSESTRRDIINLIRINKDKIKTVYLACDEKLKSINKSTAKKIIKEKYRIDDKFILFVGMIEPRKNILNLLKAFEQLKRNDLKLVVVGKRGWKCGSIFKTAGKPELKNKVIFTGFVPDKDLIYFYNSAEMLVYPSYYEGFGIPILEAMNCGCPVVTSNVSSMPEVGGNAVLLINPYSVDEIKNALLNLLDNHQLRDKLIKKGLRQSKKFSWKKCAEEMLNCYSQLNGDLQRQKLYKRG